MMRKGIILAAGIGSRLNQEESKPLVPVNDVELLIRSISSLQFSGCMSIIIILGWKADAIIKCIDATYRGEAELKYVYNPDYKLQNGISALCAKPYLDNDFILTMADHVLDDKIMSLASGATPPQDGATLCVDYKLNSIFDLEDATKVYAEGKLIKRIGKQIQKYNCIDTGVFIGTPGLLDAIEEVYQRKGDASLSEGVQLLADRGKMESLDIKDSYWQDVDTPEMLLKAEDLLKNRLSG